MRLLEVPADDLRVLGQAVACGPLEPVGEGGVQVGAGLLGERVVRGVADEEVAEAVGVLGGQCGAVGRGSLRTSSSRRDAVRPSSSGDAPRQRADVKTWPITEARPRSARSSGPRRSRRAARRAWIPGRTLMLSNSPTATQWPSTCWRRPSSMSIEIICSTNSGLPSALAATLSRTSRACAGSPRAPRSGGRRSRRRAARAARSCSDPRPRSGPSRGGARAGPRAG